MKLELLKPLTLNDSFWPVNSIVECADKGAAEYFIGMGDAKLADEKAELSREPTKYPRDKSDPVSRAAAAATLAVLEVQRKETRGNKPEGELKPIPVEKIT